MSSKAGAWKRDNLRIRCPSARAIEETGLDSSRCREDLSVFSPHFAQARSAFAPNVAAGNMSYSDERDPDAEVHKNRTVLEQRRRKVSSKSFKSSSRLQEAKTDEATESAKSRLERKFRGRKGQWRLAAEVARRNLEQNQYEVHENAESGGNLNGESVRDGESQASCSTAKAGQDVGIQVDLAVDNFRDESNPFGVLSGSVRSGSEREVSPLEDSTLITPSHLTTSSVTGLTGLDTNKSAVDSTCSNLSGRFSVPIFPTLSSPVDENEALPGDELNVEPETLQPDSLPARNRWRRLRHTMAFARHMAHIKTGPHDLLEEKRMEELNEGAGGVGAAAFEGSKTGPQPRLKGRKGMEGLIVRQDKSLIGFVQDFYVACLKMPIGYFLIGVFLAPVALSLLFMPLFILNIDGLTYDEAMAEQGLIGPLASAKEKCFALLNIFLYALSLSTTFGGSPVIAVSPYTLLVANVNTLMAQFLFVFLSGAVFARMSQPSHPIRCSKKAIIRKDDYIPNLADGNTEKFRVLSIRLVLTGPPPCELVDAKICLTFRIFVMLPSGSMFCSTQDLEVVRSEVSYLRYGLMVRHVIDKKSPVYGHTHESLVEGDASFSLTVMGLERASMQPIFHLEDYFVYDGDVVWDADYLDFIQINDKGLRVLDHSKIDLLKTFKAAGNVSKAVSRMKREVEKREQEAACGETDNTGTKMSPSLKSWVTSGIRNRKLWKCMSTSFTRAEW